MQIRPDFDMREFVPPDVWNQFGEFSRWFLDPRMLDLAQFYRDYFGAAVRINDWMWTNKGQGFTMRGFRPPQADTGASLSQHKFGRAFDCTIEGMTPDEVREAILSDSETFQSKGLTTLESGDIATTWVHSDIRITNRDDILIVTP